LKTGWNAGMRTARDVAPSAPALGPHRPPSVHRHGVDHASAIVAGPTASHPCASRARCRWPSRVIRPPSLATRHVPRAAA
jgi:hypothetical protein